MRCHTKTMHCGDNHMMSCILCTPKKALDVYQTLSLLLRVEYGNEINFNGVGISQLNGPKVKI